MNWQAVREAPRRFLAWRADHPGRIAPVFCTTTAVVIGRAWHDHGAAHRIPFVVIGVLISLIVGSIGAACTIGGAERVASYVLAVAAAVGLLAAVGYGDSLLVDTAIWFGSTVLAHVIASRHWRAERAARLEAEAAAERERIAAAAVVDSAAISATATVRSAEIVGAATVHAAALASGALDPYAVAVLVAAWAEKAELGQNAPAAIVMTGAVPVAAAADRTPVGAARLRRMGAGQVPILAVTAAPEQAATTSDAWADVAWATREAEGA